MFCSGDLLHVQRHEVHRCLPPCRLQVPTLQPAAFTGRSNTPHDADDSRTANKRREAGFKVTYFHEHCTHVCSPSSELHALTCGTCIHIWNMHRP